MAWEGGWRVRARLHLRACWPGHDFCYLQLPEITPKFIAPAWKLETQQFVNLLKESKSSGITIFKYSILMGRRDRGKFLGSYCVVSTSLNCKYHFQATSRLSSVCRDCCSLVLVPCNPVQPAAWSGCRRLNRLPHWLMPVRRVCWTLRWTKNKT